MGGKLQGRRLAMENQPLTRIHHATLHVLYIHPDLRCMCG